MKEKLDDARKALGFGLVFFGYSLYLLFDYLYEKRKANNETRARLIAIDIDRERLVSEEFNNG